MASLQTLTKYRPLTLFSCVTFLSVLWVIMLNHEEFSASETIVFCLYVTGIALLQLLALIAVFLLRKISSKLDPFAGILATIFTTFNVYTLIIVHNSRFPALDPLILGAFIACLTLIIGLLFFIRSKSFVKFSHIFCLVMTVIIGVQLVGNNEINLKGIFDRIPGHFNDVTFTKKPNVYIISLDAIAPEAVAKNNISVETVPYIDALKDEGARLIPNSFAERVPTKRSLNLVLAMDLAYFNNVSENARFIIDKVPNPTYEIFRDNGYKIQFMYGSGYFGDGQKQLDYYGIARAYGLCKHVERDYGFMGYCLDTAQNKVRRYTKIRDIKYPQMLFDRIQETAASDQPWFTYASVYSPGHAKNSTRYNKASDFAEYRPKFIRDSKKAAQTIRDMLQTIRTNDPDAITIIFGDHGSLLSVGALGDNRGLAPDALAIPAKNLPEDSILDYAAVVHDRHAVLNAIFPADACPANFRHNPYSTMRLMRDLIICLSDGQDPLPADYQANDDRWAPYMFE